MLGKGAKDPDIRYFRICCRMTYWKILTYNPVTWEEKPDPGDKCAISRCLIKKVEGQSQLSENWRHQWNAVACVRCSYVSLWFCYYYWSRKNADRIRVCKQKGEYIFFNFTMYSTQNILPGTLFRLSMKLCLLSLCGVGITYFQCFLFL